ncbi:GNAT family N-acetyltransferase [Bythopirellula polymerisocia]|uniref:BioF2-like acetyltransferase domain-containing protein n=1 Tax=Bythopirellula polymerisocia TaxID=2528003 RepID=A0A5C6CWE1_9BACT|nr:GNAT family N-acetyltransferase [Bythopirellula polymerisocia]TWU27296.1 hypothetical protein Pla144_20680 [Bythopirellula polymerisocia]
MYPSTYAFSGDFAYPGDKTTVGISQQRMRIIQLPLQNSKMHIRRVEQLEDLLVYQQRWDELAGDCVFRSWTWLFTWWKHYAAVGDSRQLSVLLVFDDSLESCNCTRKASSCRNIESLGFRPPHTLVGILPCYLEATRWQGNVLRLLGDGEVCSEHLDLLCVECHADRVAEAVARYLNAHATAWDAWHVDTIREDSTQLSKIFTHLKRCGAHICRKKGANCWSIRLPATWEEFLAMQSKSHRKQLRRLESRVLESDRAHWQLVESQAEFVGAWEALIELHQRRRKSLNQPGCFASELWGKFHRDVAQQLLETGHLRLSVLNLDKQPIAAEYHFAGNKALFVYQGGLDPDRCDEEPGKLSMIRCVQQAIAEGQLEFDLLRGDEPYKPHWRAVQFPTMDIQVVSPRTTARLRHFSANSLRNVGRITNQFANLLG